MAGGQPAAVSRRIADLVVEWELAVDGPATTGADSVIVPVRSAGEPVVLKVRHEAHDGDREHLALQRWHGRGAARLLRADPARGALLLERLGPASLLERWDLEACEVVAGLYADLHVPAMPQLRTVASTLEPALADLAGLPRDAPIPHRLVEQAVSVGRDLLRDPAAEAVVVHGDLHDRNVLTSGHQEHQGWRAIAPRPLNGDPHYEVAPLLWNRFEELAGDVRGGVRRRFQTVVDAAGMDEDRARDWVVVRAVARALAELPGGADPAPSLRTDELLTQCVAIAKAVQD